jgi:hypothetical protein
MVPVVGLGHFAVQICPIPLRIQACLPQPNHIIFNSFGVRFDGREVKYFICGVLQSGILFARQRAKLD